MRTSSFLLLVACGSPDRDGDGWPATLDCDDGAPRVHPSAAEACNGVDDDCDGQVDAGAAGAVPWFADADADGAGDAGSFAIACDAPPGSVADASDCDDGDPLVGPGATELCNGVDDDCDGRVDEDAPASSPRYLDADGDGHGDPAALDPRCVPLPTSVSLPDDCDDADPGVHPGAPETCDGVDQDCDTVVDDDATDALPWSPDADLDGFGWAAVVVTACAAPAGYVGDASDCDDFDGENHPGADERCDFVDNDCDALVDGTDAVDQPTWYLDLDQDGYGNAFGVERCEAPNWFVAATGDCDDLDAAVVPLGVEVCDNRVDDDCNGLVDECADDPFGADFTVDGRASTTWTLSAINDDLRAIDFGDIDGDGLDDLLIGAVGVDSGATRDVGTVRISYGTPAAGALLALDLSGFDGASADDEIGARVVSGIDLDADGYDEILFDGLSSSSAWLAYGGPAHVAVAVPATSADATFVGNVLEELTVAGLGDVDGDGFDDAEVTSALSTDPVGRAYLVFGGPARYSGAVAPLALPYVEGEAGDRLGTGADTAGVDLDGDGLRDVVMVARVVVDPHLHVLYGDPVRPVVEHASALPSLSALSEGPSSAFGENVAPGGDLTGDGYADVVVSDASLASYAGRVWILGGGPERWVTGALADATRSRIDGEIASAVVGGGIEGVGDLSGDGEDDLAVGSFGFDSVGVFLGPLAGDISYDAADLLVGATRSDTEFGLGIAAGDVDGDGVRDLAVTEDSQAVGTALGSVYLLTGGSL